MSSGQHFLQDVVITDLYTESVHGNAKNFVKHIEKGLRSKSQCTCLVLSVI